MSLARGTMVLVDLEPTMGHEQQGTRPCVVVSDQGVNSNQRFPLIAVVPVTGTAAKGALYPDLAPAASGLTKPSTALVDQVRSIDKQRIRRRYGLRSGPLPVSGAGSWVVRPPMHQCFREISERNA